MSSSESQKDNLQKAIQDTVTTLINTNLRIRKDDFPISDWERYQYQAFIGEGGMGRVFKAFDPRLKRSIALKFLRSDDPEMMQRFFLEAQTQARIENENICKVYEVGEVQGHPYIAMQFIEGGSLKETRANLTLEQKVKILKEVALALHAAHRIGLIHRDIKPANIMLENNEEGLTPYILDFGLAREVESRGQTVTGQIMGTPAYMSPEQALGQIHQLDRRTDVYSLGATLYELLVGHPPFQAATSIEIMLKVVKEEPLAVRKINANIPFDLETIVMKALEKEPARRYDSARALAEDLDRYLNGEPVQARPTSLIYRLTKKVKKNRLSVTIAGVAILAVITLSFMWLQTRRHAQQQAQEALERARLSQQFSQQVKQIDDILRFAYLLPLHNTENERNLIRTKLVNIEQQIKVLGRLSAGSGNYALGRGYFSLRDYQKAKLFLELAWNNGYQEPEVANALGVTYGELYRQALEELRRGTKKENSEIKQQEIAARYRDPALYYLHINKEQVLESALYSEGRIAFYEARYQDALSKTAEAFRLAPWLYEAQKLQGDIYLTMGIEKRDQGALKEAENDFNAAEQAYLIARETARSDPSIYESEAELWLQMMEINSTQGISPISTMEKVLESCQQALITNPTSIEAFVKRSQVFINWAAYQAEKGIDPRPDLSRAIDIAQEAIKINPQAVSLYNILGSAYESKSYYEISRGLEWRESRRQAIAILEKALAMEPNNIELYNNLGISYARFSAAESQNGNDPKPMMEKSIALFNKAIQLNSNVASLYKNLGSALINDVEYLDNKGIDPREELKVVIDNFQKAIDINTNFVEAYNSLGIAYEVRANYEIAHGLDPQASIDMIIKANQQALKINPKLAFGYNRIGLAYQLKAQDQANKGEDLRETVITAIDNFQRATSLNPAFAKAFINISTTYRIEAYYLLAQNIDPTDSLNKAREAQIRSKELNPDAYYLGLEQCQIELIAARWAIKQHQSPKPFLDKAIQGLRNAININNSISDPFQLFAAIDRYQAEYLIANNRPALEVINEGLSHAEKAIVINERSADAFAQQGALLFMKSHLALDMDTKQQLMIQAKTSINRAIALNSLLKREYSALLNEIDNALTVK